MLLEDLLAEMVVFGIIKRCENYKLGGISLKRKRIIALLFLVFIFARFDAAFADTDEILNGIIEENGTSYYYEDNLKFIPDTPGVYQKNGNHYYFNQSGSIKIVSEAGLYEIDGTTYYFQENSAVKTVSRNGYHKIDGMYYYMKAPYTVNMNKSRKYVSNDLVYYFDRYGNMQTYKDPKKTRLKYNGKIFELRAQAKQSVGGYDTLQGGCTDGTHAYYVLYNRNVEKGKIVKVNLTTNKVVKISKVLNIAHGNGLTYNPDENCLVAVHCTTNPKRLSVIHPNTLKVKKVVNVKIPTSLDGATKSNLKNITGFGGISYSSDQGAYAVLLSKSHNILILDENFVPQSYLGLSDKPKGVYQCINVTDDYIMIGISPGTGQSMNLIAIYEWDGFYRFTINIQPEYELECIFNVGSKLYAGFYRSSSNNRRNYIYRLTDYVWEI